MAALAARLKSNNSEYADAERYLKFTKEYMMRTPSTSPSVLFTSPKFNVQQCKYLAEKLKSTFKRAESFLKLLENGYVRFPSSEDKAGCLEVFKLLFALAIAVENFIQACCKDAWIQKSAMFLINVADHVSSIGFNLELCTQVFQYSKDLDSDDIFKDEVVAVQEKASQDMEALLGTLNERLHPKKSTSTEDELVVRLKERLERSSIKSLESQMSDLSLFQTDIKNLEQKDQLGKGSTGTVYRAKWLGVDVAMKTFSEPNFLDFEKEVSNLVGLSHPNIMALLAFAKDKHECSIVMELMPDGDLYRLIKSRMKTRDKLFPFDILEGVDIMLQIGRGMQYLHEMEFVHRDLKAENVVVRCLKGSRAETEYVVAKVADLGLSRRKENSVTYSNLTLNMGTTRWMAPEIINIESQHEMIESVKKGDAMDRKYTRKPDVHSFAMVCYEILTGKKPYSEVNSLKEVRKKILIGERPELPERRHCPDMLKHLIESCWSPDPSQRPSFPDICKELRRLKCSLLLACNNLVDTGKEPAVQHFGWLRPKVSKIQQPEEIQSLLAVSVNLARQPESLSWKYCNTALASTSGSDSNTHEPSVNRPVHNKEQLRFKWVISLDFGTTYSGFAYARRVSDDHSHINVYYKWPSREVEKPYCKTLTGLFYKPAGSGRLECASWGHLARSDYLHHRGSRHGGQGHYLTKFKLLLKKDLNDPALVASIPPSLTLDAIITDYLGCIGGEALSVVRKHAGDEMLSKDFVQWCVTVPSIWDESAKQKMRKCMVQAGLVSDGPSSIDAVKIVLEPEAASFHCHEIFQVKHKNESLSVKDKILVVDVGGGTVDIVVQELVGNSQNFQVKELTESSCELCGGTFIDDSFLRFLSERIGCLDEFLRNDSPSYKTRLLKDCEEIKSAFDDKLMSGTDTMTINLHQKLAAGWEAYETKRGNSIDDSSVVELTKQDLKSIFDPVVNQILDLIDAQVTQVPDAVVMFVVGGFAGSPYLMNRIEARFSDKFTRIVCPPNPGSAIVQGAVSLVLHPEAIVSRIVKKTYGTSVILASDLKRDPIQFKNVTNGVDYCENRFDVFVKKGSPVEVNMCVTKKYQPHTHGQTKMLLDWYSSTELDPSYTEGATVSYEGGFLISLPEYHSRKDKPEVEITMYFGHSSFEFKAKAQFKDGSGQVVETFKLPLNYYIG